MARFGEVVVVLRDGGFFFKKKKERPIDVVSQRQGCVCEQVLGMNKIWLRAVMRK